MIFQAPCNRRRSWLGMVWLGMAVAFVALLPNVASAQGMMSEQTYNRLERVNAALEEENYETARERLNAARERAGNEHEQSVIAQMSGFLYLNQEEYREALREFSEAIDIGGLPLSRELTTISNVAQLHAQFEEYAEAIEYVEQYLNLVEESEEQENAPPRVYLIGAQSHMQRNEFREALPYIRNAIELSDEPNESHYRVLLAIHFELEQYREGIDVLERMLGYWPNNMQYWFQLYSLNMQIEQDMEALNVLSLAYRKGLFETETHYKALARLYMFQRMPFESGEILTEGLEEDVVERNEDNISMLSRAWIQAEEYDRAVEALRSLAELDETGEPYLRIAQLRQQQAEWEEMHDAAMEAHERGGLDDPGDALLLAGRAAAESKNYDEALAVFNRAMEYEDVQEQASQWIGYIEDERSLLEEQ